MFDIRGQKGRLRNVPGEATSFGVGGGFSPVKDHPVMAEDWPFSPITKQKKDSIIPARFGRGSGNHLCLSPERRHSGAG